MKTVLLMKARDTAHLVRQQKQVTRNGKTFMQTVFVNPNKEQHNGRRQAQAKDTQEKRGSHFIPPQKFKAGEWGKQFIDPLATPDDASVDHVLASFGSSSAAELKYKNEYVHYLYSTIPLYRLGRAEK